MGKVVHNSEAKNALKPSASRRWIFKWPSVSRVSLFLARTGGIARWTTGDEERAVAAKVSGETDGCSRGVS